MASYSDEGDEEMTKTLKTFGMHRALCGAASAEDLKVLPAA